MGTVRDASSKVINLLVLFLLSWPVSGESFLLFSPAPNSRLQQEGRCTGCNQAMGGG